MSRGPGRIERAIRELFDAHRSSAAGGAASRLVGHQFHVAIWASLERRNGTWGITDANVPDAKDLVTARIMPRIRGSLATTRRPPRTALAIVHR